MKLSSKKNKSIENLSFPLSKGLVVGGGLLVAVILLFSSGWLYLNSQIYTPKNPNGESQKFVVVQGESVRQIASNLEAEGIIKDDFLFLVYWKLKSLNLAEQNTEPNGTSSGSALNLRPSASTKRDTSFFNLRKSVSIKAGGYSLSSSMTIPEIISKLTQGETKSNVVEVTIPEGFNTYEIDARLANKGLIKRGRLINFVQKHKVNFACEDKNNFNKCSLDLVSASSVSNQFPISGLSVSSLEGYLFPDTYKFKKGASVDVIVKKMLNNFEEKLKSLNFAEQDAELHGNTSVRFSDQVPQGSALSFRNVPRSPSVMFRDILTVASIVEKEVQTLNKKKMVAGVIYNRLEKGMKLDSCPTVIYAQLLAASDPYDFIETKRGHNPVTFMDTEIESKYNTYKNKGLPPSPISNPGLNAIKAALNPIETDYLYYLSNPAGETLFSETYEQHLRKKEEYLQ